MIKRLICRWWGHVDVPAVSIPAMVLPDVGLCWGWRISVAEASRGIGCTRCGRYVEHDWVKAARAAGMPT